MPVLKRKPKERHEYNGEHRAVLLEGRCHLSVMATGFYRDGKLHIPAVQNAWEELRNELLAKWVLEHPGRRPWAWWRFDAPEPVRRLLAGFDCFQDATRSRREMAWSELQQFGGGWYHTVGKEEMQDPPILETQAAYLERHGQLTDSEKATLGPDFPREEAMCLQEL